MYRRASRSRLDRFLAAVEVAALGVWIGALCGFAFVTAPATFRVLSDPGQIARLTTATLTTLAEVGYGCGGLAIAAALARSRDAADRTNDLVRAALVLIALGLVAYLSLGIVPAMIAISDIRSAAFGSLHLRSTIVYGGVVLLGFIALVLTAVRTDA
jgi:hypothetical protein